MSINTLVTAGTTSNPRRSLPQPFVPIGNSSTPSAYVRPADWPALSSLSAGGITMSGLYAVNNTSMEYVALSVTVASALTVTGTSVINTSNLMANPTTVVSYSAGMLLSGTGVPSQTFISAVNTATFTGTVSGSVLTVTGTPTGTITTNMVISGGTLTAGSYITTFGTGTGGAGTYNLNQTTTGSSATITGKSYSVTSGGVAVASASIIGTTPYKVDWGDGTTLYYRSGTAAQYQYTYSTLATSVTTRGYKTAVVNVSPSTLYQSGFLLSFVNLQSTPTPSSPNNTLPSTWGAKWLDLLIGGTGLSSISIGGTAPYMNLLEQVSVSQVQAAGCGCALSYCIRLQSCPTLNLGGSSTFSMADMFRGCLSLTIAPTFDTSKVTIFQGAFRDCSSLITVPVYSLTSATGVTALDGAFSGCSSLRTFPKLDYTGVNGITSMFTSCINLEYVPDFNGSSFTSVQLTFSGCSSLKNAPFINTINCTSHAQMFAGCTSLTTIPLYNTQNSLSYTLMFQNCTSLVTLPGPMNAAKVTDMSSMFNGCTKLTSLPIIINSSLLTTTQSMFNSCVNLVTVPLFDTSNVINMSGMFSTCNALVTVPLFNTAKVTNMQSMFTTCPQLKSVPTFNTANVTNTYATFNGCKNLQLAPDINTGNVTNAATMFSGATTLQLAPTLNLIKVTDMSSMFTGCTSLTSANNIANTGNVTNLQSIFQSCSSLSYGPPLDTAKTTNITNMFFAAVGMISIPTYNTINVLTTTNYLSSANSMVTVPALNFSNVTTAGAMYSSDGSLTTINTTGLKVTHSLVGTGLGKTELENYFANIAPNNTAQTLTITNVPGATTPVTQTGTSTANSNVVTFSNTVGFTTGQIITVFNAGSSGLGISNRIATINGASSYITISVTPAPKDGSQVSFTAIPGAVTGFSQYTPYYVVNNGLFGAATFQISSSNGGAAITLAGTTQSTSMLFSTYITAVNANANIVLSNQVANGAGGLGAVTARTLNVANVVLRNWTLTG
jgi:surface protein